MFDIPFIRVLIGSMMILPLATEVYDTARLLLRKRIKWAREERWTYVEKPIAHALAIVLFFLASDNLGYW